MSKKECDEFQALCQPVVDWIYENGGFHTQVIITISNATLVQEKMGVPFPIKD